MTPLELSVADGFLSVGLIGFCAGLVWLIFAWLPRRWRQAGRDVDEAIAMVCEYCRKGSLLARCTCPDGGCGIVWCEKRRVRRG